jgi:hypothetical protein
MTTSRSMATSLAVSLLALVLALRTPTESRVQPNASERCARRDDCRDRQEGDRWSAIHCAGVASSVRGKACAAAHPGYGQQGGLGILGA